MPPSVKSTFREQLATDLSDLSVLDPGNAAGAAPVEVSVRVHFVGAGTLPSPPDDPLRRRSDPGARQFRMFNAMRGDFEEVEPHLLDWLRRSPENAEAFAEDPAAVVRALTKVKPEAAERVARYFGKQRTGLKAKVPGARITNISFDAVSDAAPPTAPARTKSGEDIDCDLMIQIGLSTLHRLFADKMPEIEASVAKIPLLINSLPTEVRLLMPGLDDPATAVENGLLKLTMVFTDSHIDLLGLPKDLGPVTIEALLEPVITPLAGGRTFALQPRAGGLLVSVTNNVLNAAGLLALTNAIRDAVTPHLAFPVPLTFPPGLCDIGARDVVAALLPGSATTQPALALAFAMLDPPGGQPLSAGTTSRVGNEQDSAIFLSNLLMVKAACCLIEHSNAFETLPAETHEATEAEPFCRWEGGGGIKVAGQDWDELVHFQITSVDGGLESELKVRNSGWGWSVTATATVTMSLLLNNGELSVKAVASTVIDKHIAWWLELASAVIAIIVGAIAIAVGIFTGGVGGFILILAGSVVGIGGLLMFIGHFLLGGGFIPDDLVDPDQVLGLIPKEIGQKFGQLSFLDSLEWDDLEFGGFLTLPGTPAIVQGGEIVLSPGSAIDLDTGLITTGADITSHFDADLRLDGEPGMVAARTISPQDSGIGAAMPAAGAMTASALHFGMPFDDVVGPLRGRSLVTLGASRMLVVEGRPYASIGHSDLKQLIFPADVSRLGVPGAASGNAPVMKTIAVRTSAGRLAICAVWTDQMQRTMLRYRTFDTPVLVSLDGNLELVEAIGGHNGAATFYRSAGTLTAVPGPTWPAQPATQYRWFWSGTQLFGSGDLDSNGNTYAIAGDRCTIRTASGADLDGWLCAFASKPSGLEAAACRNFHLIGKLPGSNDLGGSGDLGGPLGPGNPGSPGVPGSPHL